MDYDILILGGGIMGCSIAYELSKYSLNIALIEKEYDIATDVSLINLAMVYDGVECEDTLLGELEFQGNIMTREVSQKFSVPFKKCGSLLVALNEAEEERLEEIYIRSQKRGMTDIRILKGNDIYKVEPNLNIKVNKALYSENTGVISPYDLAIAYGEVAFDNDVKFRLEEKVIDIQKISNGYKVITNKNKFTCKIVVNTTHNREYTIERNQDNRNKGERIVKQNLNYFLIDKDFKKKYSKIIFSMSENNEKIYSLPTFENKPVGLFISEKDIDVDLALEKMKLIIKNVDAKIDISEVYSSCFYEDKMMIDDSFLDKGYIQLRGRHYGEITMAPAIGKIVCETIVTNMKSKLKKDFTDKRREINKFCNMTLDEKNEMIKFENKYGKIVCTCKQITEGEIVDSIRRPLGARTMEGIKRRTGVMMGDCKGAYCLNKVVSIIARETNKKFTDVVKDTKGSNIVVSRIKEFDEI